MANNFGTFCTISTGLQVPRTFFNSTFAITNYNNYIRKSEDKIKNFMDPKIMWDIFFKTSKGTTCIISFSWSDQLYI